MSTGLPPPPEHVWPDQVGDGQPGTFELKHGVRYCRRCGRLLWTARDGNRPTRPCRVVKVELRCDDP